MYPYITELLLAIAGFTTTPCCKHINQAYPETVVERSVTYNTPTPELFSHKIKNKVIVYKKAPISWGKVFNN